MANIIIYYLVPFLIAVVMGNYIVNGRWGLACLWIGVFITYATLLVGK